MTLTPYFMADSIGVVRDGVVNTPPDVLCYPTLLSGQLGWGSPTLDCIQGTGYDTRVSNIVGTSFLDRLAACVAANPDIVFVEGGYNDIFSPTSSDNTVPLFTTAATSFLSGLRSGLPNAIIYVLGVYYPDTPDATIMSFNAALKSVTQGISGNTHFIDNLIDTTGSSWITALNKGVEVGADLIHLTTVGHSYMASRMALGILSLTPGGEPRMNVYSAAGGTPPGHGASSHADRTRSVWLPPSMFTSVFGSPTRANQGSWPNMVDTWVLHEATTDGVGTGLIPVPVDWASGSLTVSAMFQVPSGTGNVKLDIAGAVITPASDTVLEADGFSVTVTIAAGSSVLKKATPGSGMTVAAGDFFRLTVDRDSSNGADTATQDLWFMGVLVEYTSDE